MGDWQPVKGSSRIIAEAFVPELETILVRFRRARGGRTKNATKQSGMSLRPRAVTWPVHCTSSGLPQGPWTG